MRLPVMLASAVMALASTAVAQQPAPPTMSGMAACRDEARVLCRGVEAGRGQRLTCLQQNRDKLSATCAAALDQRMAARGGPVAGPVPQAGPPAAGQSPATPPAITPPPAGAQPPVTAGPAVRPMRACRQDLQALCASIAPGGGARMRCLRDNSARLSPPCADAIAAQAVQRQDDRADARQACRADAEQLCPGQRGPELQACLSANQDKLSATCGARFAQRLQRQGTPPTKN